MHRQTVESDPPNGEMSSDKVTNLAAEAMHSHANSRNLKTVVQRWTSSDRLNYSIELIPKEDFVLDLSRLRAGSCPVFCSLPWISDNNLQYTRFVDTPMLKMTAKIVPHCTVMNHLSCYNITEAQVDKFVEMGNWNLFIIRGDTVSEGQRFPHAADLVQYLRAKNIPEMTIAVGGYPYVHPESPSMEDDVKYLKQKVDLGADFILTQTLYDADSFLRYVDECRRAGITVPIVPGFFLPQTYDQLETVLALTRVNPPASVLELLRSHAQDEPDQFEAWVVSHFSEVVRTLRKQRPDEAKLVHFFTFNRLDVLRKILDRLTDLF
ncbi:methylenetetrahydrofolate reductase (NADPH) [Uranotaenia lowii]|uniref:methylenetetrahydrofolate reductase (NADPH) n=1 Tax=Uranotaenia lowii TaxID=190385 RepID=UPI0024797331|nr:methylenetetrahydrofolate reductase (NADPH) [Uranotaenia lowii]